MKRPRPEKERGWCSQPLATSHQPPATSHQSASEARREKLFLLLEQREWAGGAEGAAVRYVRAGCCGSGTVFCSTLFSLVLCHSALGTLPHVLCYICSIAFTFTVTVTFTVTFIFTITFYNYNHNYNYLQCSLVLILALTVTVVVIVLTPPPTWLSTSTITNPVGRLRCPQLSIYRFR